MDDLTAALAAYAVSFDAENMSATAVDAAVDHIVDALGCAVAGVDEQPARIARAFAADAGTTSRGSSAIGLDSAATPELAAFVNAVMTRCLDFNDGFSAKTGGHPSDMMAGIFAAAEMADLSGGSVVQGVFVAYEVFGALAEVVPLRDFATDQGAFVALATTAGMASILGLDTEETANALSLAITTTMPLRAARSGELSAWKGCATAHAVMNAVFVTRLAGRGMTGPPEPFRGADGFLDRVPIEFDFDHLGRPLGGQSVIERCTIKFRAVEMSAQAPVELFANLRNQFDLADIEAITISGSDFLVKEIGGGRGDAAAKWDPQTRETADHSLPYLIAVTLVDGDVTLDSFTPERVLDPALRPVMRKIDVVVAPEDPGVSWHDQPAGVAIRLRDGRVVEERCGFQLGHPNNPAVRDDIHAKFRQTAGRVLDDAATSSLLALAGDIASLPDLAQLTQALRAVPVVP